MVSSTVQSRYSNSQPHENIIESSKAALTHSRSPQNLVIQRSRIRGCSVARVGRIIAGSSNKSAIFHACSREERRDSMKIECGWVKEKVSSQFWRYSTTGGIRECELQVWQQTLRISYSHGYHYSTLTASYFQTNSCSSEPGQSCAFLQHKV